MSAVLLFRVSNGVFSCGGQQPWGGLSRGRAGSYTPICCYRNSFARSFNVCVAMLCFVKSKMDVMLVPLQFVLPLPKLGMLAGCRRGFFGFPAAFLESDNCMEKLINIPAKLQCDNCSLSENQFCTCISR